MPSQPGNDLKIRISKLPAGFAFGRKQPSAALDVLCPRPETFLTDEALPALSRVFDLAEEDFPEIWCAAGATISPTLSHVLRFGCGLARHILQESGLPSFETELLYQVDETPNDMSLCQLRLRVPLMDGIPRDYTSTAYYRAFNLIWSFVSPTFDQHAFKSLADDLSGTTINPIRSRMRKGLSTVPILKEAYRRDILITYLGLGLYQFGSGTHGRLVNKSATDRDSAIGAGISGNKEYTHVLLMGVGAPVADTVSVDDADAAAQAATTLGYPVVVKPGDLDRSLGVFIDLETEDAVRIAYDKARELSSRILVQRRIPGLCHRLVTFQGKFVFGFTRHPAGVEGDGSQTVRMLVNAFKNKRENLAKHLQPKPMPFDDEALACLSRQGLGPDDVLAEGQVAFLRDANLVEFAAHNEVITETVHPENIALAERLSKFTRLESAGIDLISPDPTVPWYENNAAITELNFKPQVGENTAKAVLEAMFPSAQPTSTPVECFVGGDAAMRAARRRRNVLESQGKKAYLTSHDMTYDASGNAYPMFKMSGVFGRATALMRNPDVEVMIVVVQTDEFLASGPPFRGQVSITRIDEAVTMASDPKKRVPKQVTTRLLDLLRGS